MNNLQNCVLDIYKEVSEICQRNGIAFYAIGGTCLGAVRHKGFIPWDDDLDIAIPIEDFDKFLDLCSKELPNYYKLRTNKDVKHTPLLFAKVIDERTTFIEKFEVPFKENYKGAFIDIMPLAGIPDEGKQRNKFFKKLNWLKKFNFLRRNIYMNESIKRKIARILFFPIYIFLPYHFYSDKIYKLFKKYPFNKYNYTGYLWHEANPHDKLIFYKDWFKTCVDLPFEDTTMSCPIEYDKYLSRQFGDYMVLPPEKERLVHNGLVDLEKPYTWYQEHDDWKNEKVN